MFFSSPAMFFVSLALMFTLFLQVEASCQNFTQYGSSYFPPSQTIEIVSSGYTCHTPSEIKSVCNPDNQCAVQYGGVANAFGTNNLSLSQNDVLPLYDLVASKATNGPVNFLFSYSQMISNFTACVNVTENSTEHGYFGLTPDLFCINGTLTECSDGPVEDGTAISICGVNVLAGLVSGTEKYEEIMGDLGFVTTDQATAANITTNPALTRSPVATLPKDEAKPRSGGGRVNAFDGLAMGLIFGGALSVMSGMSIGMF